MNLLPQFILDFIFRRSEYRGARPVLRLRRQIVTFQTHPTFHMIRAPRSTW